MVPEVSDPQNEVKGIKWTGMTGPFDAGGIITRFDGFEKRQTVL